MNLSEIVKKYNKKDHGTFKEYFSMMNDNINKNVLSDLQLNRKEINNMIDKLKNYKYIEEVDDLKYGAFIRWIVLTDTDNLALQHAGMICNIKFTNTETIISCKNFMQKYYTIKLDECLIFQKITDEEKIMIEMIEGNITL